MAPRKSASSRRTGHVRPRNARSRSGRTRQPSRVWHILTVIAVIAVLGAGGYFYFRLSNRADLDPVTLCPDDGAVGAVVAVLDLTDPLTQPQKDRLTAILSRETSAAEPGTLISIGTIQADPALRGVDFQLCKLRSGENANQLYENPTLIQERYHTEFKAPFDALLESVLSLEKQDSSPIIEGLQATVAGTDGFEFIGGPKRLILVSDLLQHSDVLSFYRGQDWQDFTASGGSARLSGNLTGVSIDILRVPRQSGGQIDLEAVDDFWRRYFDLQGAASITVRILGDL